MYCAVVQSKNGNTQATLDELNSLSSHIPFLPPSETNGVDYNYMRFFAANHKQFNSIDYFYDDDPAKSYSDFIWAVTLMISLFCAVPLTNLVNLNIGRIIDRSAEIGVRKAFGANNNNILVQIITENIVLTLIGGALGLTITIVIMHFANTYKWIGELHLIINFTVFLLSLFVTLVFGILSGYLPAMKMAKSSIVESIKYK
jgi:putative ABC transport system permease protein